MFDAARWYAKLRGSPIFVVGLLAFVSTWLILHALFNFDHAFGALNLVLSTEASVSLAFFTMMGDRQASDNARSMRALADTIDEIRAMNKVLLASIELQRADAAARTVAAHPNDE